MFDYVMTFAAVVIGLAVTHLMQGLATLIEDPGKGKIWWVHLTWVAYMLLTSAFWWWFEYMLHDIQTWTFGVYAFVLLYAFLTYLTASVLFPKQLKRFHSYEEYFLARRSWFFGLVILATVIDPIDSALKGKAHLESLGVEYWVANAITIGLAVLGIWTRRRNVQGAIAVVFLVYQVSWVARLFATVS